jgi:hypothetical protein
VTKKFYTGESFSLEIENEAPGAAVFFGVQIPRLHLRCFSFAAICGSMDA